MRSLALAVLAVGCAGTTAQPPRAPAPGGRITYEVTADAAANELRVTATFPPGTASLTISDGSERFVEGLVDEAGRPLARRGDAWPIACARGCVVGYRFLLRKAGDAFDDPDSATAERTIVEAPPATWLIRPAEAPGSMVCRLHVTVAAPSLFVTGLYRAKDAADAWDVTLDDLWSSPYSAFGSMRSRILDVAGAKIELAIAPGKLAVDDDVLARWVEQEGRAVATYFGRFPVPSAAVLIVPGRSRWIGLGKTLAGGGASIMIRVGEHAPARALEVDWVLAHEMTHLAFPSMPRNQQWIEEGLATYVEPIARTHAGLTDAEETWRGFVEGMPNGLPRAGDRGLDRTPTWGRVYWGGALFCLVADVEIRKATSNRKSLQDALRAILAAGGDNAHRWRLSHAFEIGDAATGTHVLRDLYGRWAEEPVDVDLPALFRELGVALENGRAVFDDRAAAAPIRAAITAAGSAVRP